MVWTCQSCSRSINGTWAFYCPNHECRKPLAAVECRDGQLCVTLVNAAPAGKPNVLHRFAVVRMDKGTMTEESLPAGKPNVESGTLVFSVEGGPVRVKAHELLTLAQAGSEVLQVKLDSESGA